MNYLKVLCVTLLSVALMAGIASAANLVLNVPEAQTMQEDTKLEIEGISVEAPELENQPLLVTISCSKEGNLTLNTTEGLDLKTGDGKEDAAIVFKGTLAKIQNALSKLTYQTKSEFSGSDKISILIVSPKAKHIVEGTIPVTVQSVSDAPTEIKLSNTFIAPNSPVGTVVGELMTIDSDREDSFTYSLIEDVPFSIQDNQLIVADKLDFSNRKNYSVEIRVMDSSGLTHDETFIISPVYETDNN